MGDTILLSQGYVKVGFLGRDAVFAKISTLTAAKGHLPGFELLNRLHQAGSAEASGDDSVKQVLPPGWTDFHYKVLADEKSQEEYLQARIRREVLLKKQGRTEKEAEIEAKQIVDAVWAQNEQLEGGYLPDEADTLRV